MTQSPRKRRMAPVPGLRGVYFKACYILYHILMEAYILVRDLKLFDACSFVLLSFCVGGRFEINGDFVTDRGSPSVQITFLGSHLSAK